MVPAVCLRQNLISGGRHFVWANGAMRSLDRNPASTCIERAGSSRGSVLQYTGTVMIITIISILRALGVRKLVTTQKKILQNRMLILKVPLKHHGPSHAPSSSRLVSSVQQARPLQCKRISQTHRHTHTHTNTHTSKQTSTHTHRQRHRQTSSPVAAVFPAFSPTHFCENSKI